MKEIIKSFCLNHLKEFKIEIQDLSDDMINMYVEKETGNYKLLANIVTLEKMNFHETDIKCLLFHEKGHYELKHLEVKNNFWINLFLSVLLIFIFFMLLVLNIFTNINYLLILSPLSLAFYLGYDNLQYLKRMRESEIEADGYACTYCNKDDFISMLEKMEIFYSGYQNKKNNKLLYLLETHPSTEKRIKSVLNYSSIY